MANKVRLQIVVVKPKPRGALYLLYFFLQLGVEGVKIGREVYKRKAKGAIFAAYGCPRVYNIERYNLVAYD